MQHFLITCLNDLSLRQPLLYLFDISLSARQLLSQLLYLPLLFLQSKCLLVINRIKQLELVLDRLIE